LSMKSRQTHARNGEYKSIETGLPSGWLSVFGTGKNGYQPFRSGISFGSQPLHFALNIVFDTANGYRVGVDDNIARTLVSVVRKAYTAAVHDRAFSTSCNASPRLAVLAGLGRSSGKFGSRSNAPYLAAKRLPAAALTGARRQTHHLEQKRSRNLEAGDCLIRIRLAS